jgi:SAM-dependent methyltransferase
MTDHRDVCATCGSAELAEIVNLGMHPMADTFVPANRVYEGDRVYPLICDLCERCAQVQLRTISDPGERYSHFDYSYTSSNSAFSRSHWTKYATAVSTAVGLPSGALVVEIGSNDGYLSARFIDLGFRAVGVDPSKAMCELAAKNGVDTHCTLFTKAVGRELAASLPTRPQLIVANNVVNHANDPRDFAEGVRELLDPSGTFVFELPYWLRTVVEGRFDQIYHEHVSYFSVAFSRNLFRAAGLAVVRAEEVDYHGGSIRVYVKHEGTEDASVEALVARERAASLFDRASYRPFMNHIRANRDRFMRRVFELRSAGEPIVCVGAAAKANTFLNYYNLDASVIDWVTDASPNKIGKFTPRTRVPIIGDAVLARYDRVHAIITSWNLADTLRTSLLAINPRIEFLNPYEER